MQHLGAEFGLSKADAPRFRSKASAWRGLMAALRGRELFEGVRSRVPPEVVALMDRPPLGAAWMPAVAFQYAFRGLAGLVDDDEVQVVASESVFHGPMKVMRPLVEGSIRLFGPEPAGLFKRIPKIMAQQIEGVRFVNEEVGVKAHTISVSYEHIHDLPVACFTYWAGIFSVVFEICGIPDVESEVEIDDARRSCRIHYRW